MDFNREEDQWRELHRQRKEEWKERWKHPPHTPAGRIMGGIVLVAVGAVLLAHQVGTPMPAWLFSWEMLVVVIGLYIGAKHTFRGPGWAIVMLAGGLFLLDDIFPGFSLGNFIWPVLIIAFGLAMILKPKKQHGPWKRWKEECERRGREFAESRNAEADGIDTLEIISVLGGIKKTILSKSFKGGEVVCVFGGSEINLMQADIQGRVVLEITQIFGGTRLIVPAHWDIQPEMAAVLGGIEDKRPLQKDSVINPEKVLVLKGISVMGGIDIKSY